MGERRTPVVAVACGLVFVAMFAVWVLLRRPARDPAVEDGRIEAEGASSRRTPVRVSQGPRPPASSPRGPAVAGGAGGAEGGVRDADFSDTPFPDEEQEAARARRVDETPAGTLWTTDAEGIQSAIFESLGEIKECYEGWLELQPDLAGTIVVRFVISADGEQGVVSEAVVTDGTLPEHTFFDGCVLNVMSNLEFEAPVDGGQVAVNYPFAFSSASE